MGCAGSKSVDTGPRAEPTLPKAEAPASEAPASEAPASEAPAYVQPSGTASQVTIVPIKPGSKDALLAVANSPDMAANMKDLQGSLNEVAFFFTEDGEKLVARSTWASPEALAGSDEKQGKAMGPMKEHMAGAPERMRGTIVYTKTDGLATLAPGEKGHSRVTVVPIKPGSQAAMLALMDTEETKANLQMDGMVALSLFFTDDNKLIARTVWTTAELLAASDALQAKAMAPMKEHMAGAPIKHFGQLAWSFSPSDAASGTPGAIHHRITKIPIKEGAMADIVEVAKSDAMQEVMKTFVGFHGVEALSVDASTMITHSRWESKEACDGGAAALGKVLKELLGAFIAGPPEAPLVGPKSVFVPIAEGTPGAYRMGSMKLKEGAMPTVMAYVPTKEAEFKAIDGLLSVTVIEAAPDTVALAACYTTSECLEAATPIIMPIIGALKEHFAAPPELMTTKVEWSHGTV